MITDVCMMNEPASNELAELAAISRLIKIWGLMANYIPSSQYVWGSSILVSQTDTLS